MAKVDYYPSEFRWITIATIVVIIIGVLFYHIFEHWSWLDAFYFCVVTLATVGYGDIVPKTPLGKLFTTIYIFVGIGIIAFFVNTLVKRAYVRRLNKLRSKTYKKR